MNRVMSAPASQAPVRPREHVVLLVLAATSGAVDAFTLLYLGRVFAGVMTGNMVLLGAAAVNGDGDMVRHAVAALVGFIAGVACAGAASDRVPAHALLLVELALLAIPAVVWAFDTGHTEAARAPLILAAALAMGLQAGTWETPSTYFTGTLVRLARRAGRRHTLGTEDLWALGRIGAVVTGAAAVVAVDRTWSRGAGFVTLALAVAALCTILATRERAEEPDDGQ